MISRSIKERMREYFFTNPTSKLRIRQIERTLEVPLPSAIRYAKELVKEGILNKEETAGIVLFSADRSSKSFLLEKRLFNIRQLHDSGLIYYLVEKYENPVIILFGSYSRGEDTEESDIDLYIETPSKKDVDVEKFEKRLNRKIQIFRHQNIRHVNNHHLANNIMNGIILNGFIGVFK